MKTNLLNADDNAINLACQLLKNGEVIGIPTETVYGLAGDAKNPSAIKKIFEAKGRPCDNPLIVHISDINMLDSLVSVVPNDAKLLAQAFWPGPLTIIMPKGSGVCNEACAGLSSVGIRMPSNKIAQEIIRRSNTPFAAPSANLSGKPSPTTALDVYSDMNGKIPLIIDGGECFAGVESTVVSVLEDTPIILRPGIITAEDMSKVLGKKIKIANAITEEIKSNEKVLSPGMKYKHYAPNAEITILNGDLNAFIEYVNKHKTPNTFVLCFDDEKQYFENNVVTYGTSDDPISQAHNLFSALRQLDKLNAKIVYARSPQKNGISLAVYNRLIRSAGFKIIDI